MDFWNRMQEAIDKGVDSSRDLLGRAREKAKDMGERGVVRFEIMQLESQAEKLVAKLGSVVFDQLMTEGRESVSKTTPEIGPILGEIEEVRGRIAEKEAVLRALDQAQRSSDSEGPNA
jgi:hypothetical protein